MVDKRPTERWSFFKNSCPVVGSTSAVVFVTGEMSSTWSAGQDAKEVFRGHWFRDLVKVSVKKPLSSQRRNSSFEHFWWSVSESLFCCRKAWATSSLFVLSCRSSEKVLQRCLRMKKGGTFQLQATRPLELRCRGNLRSQLEAPVRTRS